MRKKIIWSENRKKTIKFLNDPNADMLLIRSGCGTGKSVTILRTLIELGVRFAFLRENHKSINNLKKNEVIVNTIQETGADIRYLKGRERPSEIFSGQKMCRNDALIEAGRRGINTEKMRENCIHKDNCEWLEQWDGIDTCNGYLAPHAYLDIIHYKESLSVDVIVVDESNINLLYTEETISINELEAFSQIVTRAMNQLGNSPKKDTLNDILMSIIDSLIQVLEYRDPKSKRQKGLRRQEFIDVFFSILEDELNKREVGIFPFEIEWWLDGRFNKFWWIFQKKYYEILEEKVTNHALPKHFREILDTIINIFKRLIKHRLTPELKNVGISKRLSHQWQIQFVTTKCDLADTKIIFLDATGDDALKELYESVFDRKIEMFSPSVNIKRNIDEIIDGAYSKRSLLFDKTRNYLYSIAAETIRKNKSEGRMTLIITYHALSTIKRNKIAAKKYRGKSIEHFLKKAKGITKDDYKIIPHSWSKAFDDEKVKKNARLIYIGRNMPDEWSFRTIVESFYEDDENPVSSERIERDDFTEDFVDSRYGDFINIVTSYPIEHGVGRLRCIDSPEVNHTLKLGNTPISYPTNKMTKVEYLLKLNNSSSLITVIKKALSVISEYQSKEGRPISKKEFTKKIRFWKDVKALSGIGVAGDEIKGHDLLFLNMEDFDLIKLDEIPTKRRPKITIVVSNKGKRFVE